MTALRDSTQRILQLPSGASFAIVASSPAMAQRLFRQAQLRVQTALLEPTTMTAILLPNASIVLPEKNQLQARQLVSHALPGSMLRLHLQHAATVWLEPMTMTMTRWPKFIRSTSPQAPSR